LQGPDSGNAGYDQAYRIKAPCEKLEIAFTVTQNSPLHGAVKPFTTKVGSLVTYDGHPWDPTAYERYNATPMGSAFGPHRDEVVVIAGGQVAFDYVKCVA
jgi:hypothetical protein